MGLICLFLATYINLLIRLLIYFFFLLQFLSMKLSAVNPRLDFNIEGILSKSVSELGILYSYPIVCIICQLVCHQMPVKSRYIILIK